MIRFPNKAAYLLGLYLGLLLSIRFGTELLIRNFVLSLGFAELEVRGFVFDNEMNLQAFCLVLALVFTAWITRLSWFNLTKLGHDVRGFFVLSRSSDLAHLFSESTFRGFIVASLGVGMSVFLGYSVLEVPSFREVAWFKLLPALLIQGFLLALWVALIDFQRYFLYRAWVETADRNPQHGFFSEALVSRIGVVGFETLFYFWVLNSSYFWLDRFYLGLLCLLMAAGQLLWFELSLRGSPAEFTQRSLERVLTIFAFAFSLIHIFGQNIGGFKRVSWMSSFPGPLREPTGNLATASPAGQILFALLLVACINLLLRKALKST